MTKRLFAKYNGLTEYAHFDPMKPGDLIIETVQDDFTGTLERTKELREGPVGKEWRHVACVPNIVMHQAIQEGWDKDKAAWRKWLNDPDNKYFRTWPGRIGTPGQH